MTGPTNEIQIQAERERKLLGECGEAKRSTASRKGRTFCSGAGAGLELHVQRANEQGGIVLQRQRIADAQFVCLN